MLKNKNFSDHDFTNALTKLCNSYLQSVTEQPTSRYLAPETLAPRYSLSGQAHSFEEVCADLTEIIHSVPKTFSTTFFNQLFGGVIPIAVSAEMMTALTNNSMYTYKSSGPYSIIEKSVIDRMLEKVGYLNGEGTFNSGGSISNLMAMMLARNEKVTSIRNQGMNQNLIAYVSVESHYSFPKAGGILGIGRDNVRGIPTDSNHMMRVDVLRHMIESDLSVGATPFFVGGTAGTTVFGAFDPFEEIGKLAREFGLWFHIDGSWGGSVILHEGYQELLGGRELSDSFAWNAHKMMNVPLSAAVLLCRKKSVLLQNLSEKADYLFQTDLEYNRGDMTLQCGRRNDALKVWAAWQQLGDKGFSERIDKQFSLANYAIQKIQKNDDFQLVHEPSFLNVCFAVNGKNAKVICETLFQQHVLHVGYGNHNNQSFVRLICVNPDLEFADIDTFFTAIKKLR